MNLIVLKLLFVAFLTYQINCDSVSKVSNSTTFECEGSGWVLFNAEKCFKLIKQWSTRKGAVELCTNEWLPSETHKPALVTIKTAEEQAFLHKFIFETAETDVNVWLGAKRDAQNASQFLWDDGSVVEYGNWAVGSPSGQTKRECVDLQAPFTRNLKISKNSAERQVAGKWRDVTCNLGNFVVCQKIQPWSLAQLQQAFLDSLREQKAIENKLANAENRLGSTQGQLEETKNRLEGTNVELDKTNKKLEDKSNSVPIGFTYVQLPKDKSPKVIWPSLTWTDVSSDYAGVFFRVEGGDAAAFGTKQSGNAPRLTGVKYDNGANVDRKTEIQTRLGDWSDYCITAGYDGAWRSNSYQMSSGEVRPVNMAIRVWKRTG